MNTFAKTLQRSDGKPSNRYQNNIFQENTQQDLYQHSFYQDKLEETNI